MLRRKKDMLTSTYIVGKTFWEITDGQTNYTIRYKSDPFDPYHPARADEPFVYNGIIERTVRYVANKSFCLRGDVIAVVKDGKMYIGEYSYSLIEKLRAAGYKDESFFVPLSTSGDLTPWSRDNPPRPRF